MTMKSTCTILKHDDYLHITFHGNIPSKKNSKQIVCRGNRPMLLPSKSYDTWHKECMEFLRGSKAQNLPRRDVFRCIEVQMYHKLNKDGTEPKKRFDLSNKFESIADLLVDAGIITDDDYKVLPQVVITFGGYREEQGAEVYLHYF